MGSPRCTDRSAPGDVTLQDQFPESICKGFPENKLKLALVITLRAGDQNTIALPMSVVPIPRIPITDLTAKRFFDQHRRANQPAIILDLLPSQPSWNLDFLCQHLGEYPTPVRAYGRQRYQQDKRQWQEIGRGMKPTTLSFREFAQLIQTPEAREQDIYLAKFPLTGTPLEHHSVLEEIIHRLGLTLPATGFNLWIGPGGHTTCLHYDPVDSLLIQLQGNKKVVLFPPSELNNLYPFPLSVHLQHGLKLRASYSQVYPDRPDFSAFPKLQQALKQRYEVTLQAGEVLYLPAGWWHEITTLGNGVVCSINRFWHPHPLTATAWSWHKWRVHLGSVFAVPKILCNGITHPQSWQSLLRRI